MAAAPTCWTWASSAFRENRAPYVDHIYGEHEAGGTAWMYISPAPFEQAGFDVTVPKEPILNNYVKISCRSSPWC